MVYNSNLSLYPNPVSDNLNIINLSGTSIVEILNVTGKVIYTERVNNSTHSINTEDLVKGLYFVRINRGGEITSHKFIKQ